MDKSDNTDRFAVLTAREGLIVALFLAPILALFWYLEMEGVGFVTASFAAGIGITTRILWPLRVNRWFWWGLSIIVILHATIIIMGEWRVEGYPSVMFWPLIIGDLVLVMGIMLVLEKIARDRKWE